MAKSRFRIIALRPITPKGRDEETIAKVKGIQKKVFGKEWMYFYSGYKLKDVENGVADKYDVQPLYGHSLTVSDDADNDGMLYDTDGLAVSISAVVGQNGSGKSSAVELMIRILNNLSVAAKGETYNHKSSEHLFFIENVYGSIVAVEGDLYFQIQVFGRSVKIARYQWSTENRCYICDQMTELLSANGRDDKFKPIEGNGLGLIQLDNFFYTAIFNYSMYAYNYKDYYDERTLEDRWRDRKDNDNRQLMYNGKYTQEQNWLMGLFHKNDGYQTPIVLNPMRDNGNINVPKENKLAAERLNNMLLYSSKGKKGHGGQPIFPFRVINDHLEVVAIRISQKEDCYFSRDNLFETLRYKGNSLTRNFDDVRTTLCTTWSKLFCMGYHEETEHEKLAWDYVVYKTLKIAQTYDKYNRLENALIYFKQFNPERVEVLLSEMLQDETHITLKLRQTLCFLKFQIFREDYRELIPLYDVYERYARIRKTFEDMDIKMDGQDGQLTANVPEGYETKDLPVFTTDPHTGHVVLKFSDDIKRPIPLFYISEGELYAKTPDIMEVMLPPIFDATLMVIEQNKIRRDGSYSDKDLIPMYGLSSGERQISGIISNFAYHLVNIDSVWKDNYHRKIETRSSDDKSETEDVEEKGTPIRYKYINAVFDEVELYFHPDLQRRFVSYLTSALGNLHLENVKGLNIMMVTHSPFVLSDLPRANVLALGGENDVNETFCANIHEMLGNSFFMDYTVGDVARKKVEEILGLYNKFTTSKNKRGVITREVGRWSQYRYVAGLIADEYLHGLTNRMLDEMEAYLPGQEDDLDTRISQAEAQLKALKARKARKEAQQ